MKVGVKQAFKMWDYRKNILRNSINGKLGRRLDKISAIFSHLPSCFSLRGYKTNTELYHEECQNIAIKQDNV